MSDSTIQLLRQQIADATRMMVMADLMDYSGHVSARVPGTDQILIQGRDPSRATLSPKDVLLLDLEGKVLEGDGPPPSETALHLGIYRARPDAQAVCHGHPPMSILFTMTDQPMVAIRNYGYRFMEMPIHADTTHIRTEDQGRAVAETLGSHGACLLRAHGTAVVANSVQELFMDCLEMEENARSVVQAASLGGKLKPITRDEAAELKISYGKNDYRIAKIWEHYQEKARLAGIL